MTIVHQQYMQRAIFLAQKGTRLAYPNPSVGAVIVCDNKIIGEGYTSSYGGAHAEVNAINAVKDKSLLKKATLYVTLEPCSHFGKTPPCASLIVKTAIPNVIVGCLDINELVAGKGIAILKEAGVNVCVGLLEEECKYIHRKFFTYHLQKRPYVILKWAQTSDGFLDLERAVPTLDTAKPNWITNQYSRQLTHVLRANEQAILVGTNTVLKDNPSLLTRDVYGLNPIRIVIDLALKINKQAQIYDQLAPTIVYTYQHKESEQLVTYVTVNKEQSLVSQILEDLYQRKIQTLIVEGGKITLQSFIEALVWDEAWVFEGKKEFKNGLKAPEIKGVLLDAVSLQQDNLKRYKPN